MSILTVPATTPLAPGFIGNPYTPWDIGVFYDLNWPDDSGVHGQGMSVTGLASLRGLGQCVDTDPDTGLCLDSGSTPVPTLTPAVCPSGQVDNGGGICIPTSSPNFSCSSVALSSMSAEDMLNCGYTTTLGGPLVNPPLNTPVTPTQAGLTAAQQAQLIAATGNSAVSLIRTAAGGPYQVAGTNLIYNPATGQLTTAAATNATATLTAGLAGLTPYIPYIAIAIAAIVVLPMLTGKK